VTNDTSHNNTERSFEEKSVPALPGRPLSRQLDEGLTNWKIGKLASKTRSNRRKEKICFKKDANGLFEG
jgi:hypothetical protein